MKALLVMLWSLLIAVPAAAQTHPCDVLPVPSVVNTTFGLVLWFCVKPSDDLLRVDITVDDAQAGEYVESDVEAQSGPSAEGYVLFRAPFPIEVAPGTHTIRLTAINDDGTGQEQAGDVSDPVSFSVKRARPSKAKVVKVTQ